MCYWRHYNYIFIYFFFLGVLQRDSGDGSDWQQDCLASLLKLLCHLGVDPLPHESRPSRNDKIVIPSLNEAMLSMVSGTKKTALIYINLYVITLLLLFF